MLRWGRGIHDAATLERGYAMGQQALALLARLEAQ
jgi:hypothetical protein